MKKEMLYIDASSGISGDMFVAALLDLGADREVLQEALDSLPVPGFSIRISRVQKSAIDCCDFAVILDEAIENHDHDMEYLHGHEHGHDHSDGHTHAHDHTDGDGHAHDNTDEHTHAHEHDHTDRHTQEHNHTDGLTHAHTHRNLADIRHILSHAVLTDGARELAERIFLILAEAEASVHGKTIDEIHFHEVGAVDSIVDITAAAVCMDNLGISDVIIPGICEGSGTVRTQHGILPVPVPAVTAIASAYGLPLHFTGHRGEFVTPTGAAIAAAIMTGEELPEKFRVRKLGIGAGKRKYDLPGMLRIMRIEAEAAEKTDKEPDKAAREEAGISGLAEAGRDVIWKLETNLDDCTGEILGYTMERLFEAGARDVHYMPVFMKKNRPGWQLNVICDEDRIPELEKIIFDETTTIGIRRVKMARTVLLREEGTKDTVYGPVKVKKCMTGDDEKIYPEYESAAGIAREKKIPLDRIYREVRNNP